MEECEFESIHRCLPPPSSWKVWGVVTSSQELILPLLMEAEDLNFLGMFFLGKMSIELCAGVNGRYAGRLGRNVGFALIRNLQYPGNIPGNDGLRRSPKWRKFWQSAKK